MITHYGLFRKDVPNSPMIKDAEFFQSQGGLTEDWGQNWEPINDADSISSARHQFAKSKGVTLSPIYGWE